MPTESAQSGANVGNPPSTVDNVPIVHTVLFCFTMKGGVIRSRQAGIAASRTAEHGTVETWTVLKGQLTNTPKPGDSFRPHGQEHTDRRLRTVTAVELAGDLYTLSATL